MAVTPFNRLKPAQLERLALLLEELGEAQQAVGKVLRHGYESSRPGGVTTNRNALERELGDVLAALELLEVSGDLRSSAVNGSTRSKLERVRKWMHHQSPVTFKKALAHR